MAGLADIPFLGGYTQQGAINRAAEGQNLNQAIGVQGLLAKVQASRQAEQDRAEMQRMQPILAEAYKQGKLPEVIGSMVSSGNPKLIELASKLKGFAPKPATPYTLSPGSQRFGVDNQPVASVPFAPAADKGTWSDPYDMNGAKVQRNTVTGQIRTAVARPPAPPQPQQEHPIGVVGPDGVARLERVSNVKAWEGKQPSGANFGGVLNSQTVRERQLATGLERTLKPYQDTMKSYQNFEEIKATTGDNSQANQFLAQSLVDMGRRGTRALPKAELERILGSGDLGNDWLGRAGNMLTQMAAGVRTPTIDKRFQDLADAMARSAATRISQEIQNTRARTPQGMNVNNVVGATPTIYGRFIITPTGKIHEFGSAQEAQQKLDEAAKLVGQ